MFARCRSFLIGVGLLAGSFATPALAHPHAFVGVRSVIITNAEGQVVGLRHAWSFDEMFSAYAKQGLDKNGDGKWSREELQELAEINVTSVEEFHYFTRVKVAGQKVAFGKPTDYWLEEDAKGNLVLNFDLPFAAPVGGKGVPVSIQISDPEYWVAMELGADDPIKLAGEGKGCTLEMSRPKPLEAGAAQALSQLSADVRQLPGALSGVASQQVNHVQVVCP